MTKNKKDILNLIQTTTKHLTAEEIYLTLKEINKSISLSTVYRNLGILEEEKLIKKYDISETKFVYDKSIIPHAHAINDDTQEVVDVHNLDLTSVLEKYVNGKVTSYDLVIHFKEK